MSVAKKRGSRGPVRLDPKALKVRELAIISDLRAGALSYRMIAKKHKVSLPTVNAKARKAGIRRPRGRRPMGVTKVRPITVKRRGRPVSMKVVPPKAAVSRRRRRVRRPGRAVARPRRTAPAGGAFADAFREMVLRYFPALTLRKFDRLAKLVAREVA